MANNDAPMGLVPVKHSRGGTVRSSEYNIASALAANIFRGDLVKSTGTGRNITVCAAGERAVGVFMGVNYVDSAGNVTFSPRWATGTVLATGTKAVALVVDDPDVIFEVQASAAFAEADVGNVADIVAGAGNATTGQSGFELDSATLSAAGSAQLKTLALSPAPSNEYGTNAKAWVLINEHELRAALTAT